MCDSTPVGLRLRRAVKVLNRHQVHMLQDLTLPDGAWKQFVDLPIPKWEQRWSVSDYTALCTALARAALQPMRAQTASRGGQQLLCPIRMGPLLRHHTLGGVQLGKARVVSDKHRRIVGVAEPGQQSTSFWCHFQPPAHPKAERVPDRWESDRELGEDLVKAETILTVRVGTPSRTQAMECAEVFCDAQGETFVTM